MRMLNYETDAPLRQVGILLTPDEARQLLDQLLAVLQAGNGYARLEDADWGEVDFSLYTPDNLAFLHSRTRRLIEQGE